MELFSLLRDHVLEEYSCHTKPGGRPRLKTRTAAGQSRGQGGGTAGALLEAGVGRRAAAIQGRGREACAIGKQLGRLVRVSRERTWPQPERGQCPWPERAVHQPGGAANVGGQGSGERQHGGHRGAFSRGAFHRPEGLSRRAGPCPQETQPPSHGSPFSDGTPQLSYAAGQTHCPLLLGPVTQLVRGRGWPGSVPAFGRADV